jgi:hypothetical protein
MVTRINIEFYLHYGCNEKMSNKAAGECFAHLAAKQFTTLKAGSCLLLITTQPG